MRVLIYSPELGGHRQIYCDVITDILLELGAEVVLAVGLSTEGGLTKWRNISHYQTHPNVKIVDCCQFSSDQRDLLTAEEIIALQRQYSVDVTVLAEADLYRAELLRIGLGKAPRLEGWNVGIFARISNWYLGESSWIWYPSDSPPGGSDTKRSFIRRGLSRLKRLVFPPDHRRSHEFFFQEVIGGQRVLDIALVKDERIAEGIGDPYAWFPDIYEPIHVIETEEDKLEYDALSTQYQDFLARQAGREVLLHYGNAARYRGYDILLKLAEWDDSTCFVHCGQLLRDAYEPDVMAVKSKLLAQGRFFETGRYMHSQRLVDLFFASTSRMVSTHRLVGSSGTMLQALSAGKPVLVPDAGLLGYRVKGNNLGMTYRPGDLQDLFQKWQVFKATPVDIYTDSIRAYMKRFDRDSMVHLWQQVIFPKKSVDFVPCAEFHAKYGPG